VVKRSLLSTVWSFCMSECIQAQQMQEKHHLQVNSLTHIVVIDQKKKH
jgi:hypothetical protein